MILKRLNLCFMLVFKSCLKHLLEKNNWLKLMLYFKGCCLMIFGFLVLVAIGTADARCGIFAYFCWYIL